MLTTNVTIGDHVHLNLKVTIGHDSQVGSFSTLNSHADITGAVVVEEAVFMGSHAVVLPRGHVGAYSRLAQAALCCGTWPPATPSWACRHIGSSVRHFALS